jgi:hypothetical protein
MPTRQQHHLFVNLNPLKANHTILSSTLTNLDPQLANLSLAESLRDRPNSLTKFEQLLIGHAIDIKVVLEQVLALQLGHDSESDGLYEDRVFAIQLELPEAVVLPGQPGLIAGDLVAQQGLEGVRLLDLAVQVLDPAGQLGQLSLRGLHPLLFIIRPNEKPQPRIRPAGQARPGQLRGRLQGPAPGLGAGMRGQADPAVPVRGQGPAIGVVVNRQ